MKNFLLFLCLFLLASPVGANGLPSVDYAAMFFQPVSVTANRIRPSSSLSGSCNTAAIGYDIAAGTYKACIGGTWTTMTTGTASGANTALSNLASVAINTALLPGTVNTADLGSTTKWWRDVYFGTSASFYTKITTTPTANRTFTLPDASIIAAGSASALTSGRIPYVTTGGLLTDDTSFRFDVGQPRLSTTGFLSIGTHNADSAAANIVYTSAFSHGLRVFSSDSNAAITLDSTSSSTYLNYRTAAANRWQQIAATTYFQMYNYTTASTGWYLLASNNALGINLGTAPTAQLDIRPFSASTVGQVIRLASTPTANAFQVENSSGTALTSIDASGRFYPVSIAHASLGTPSDGAVVYCSDCTKATPCASGGSGALAKRLNGAWDCD